MDLLSLIKRKKNVTGVEQGEEQVDGAKKTSKQVSYTFAYYTICPIIFICFFVQKASDSNGKKSMIV